VARPGALAGMVDLACAAEAAGYRRFWIAEHHVPDTSHAAPEVVAAVVAARTSRIRVGSGAVILRYYSPLKVAETFLALEALFPGRIDLGVAQGPGVVDEAVAQALVGGNAWELQRTVFDRKVHELSELLRLAPATANPPRVRAQPDDVVPPPLWVLGSGRRSRELAVRLRRPYAMAVFVAGPNADVAGPAAEYRSRAATSPLLVAVSVTTAASPAEATSLDAAKVGSGLLAANLVGDHPSVAARLAALREETGADELLLTSFGEPPDRWQESLASIAAAWPSA